MDTTSQVALESADLQRTDDKRDETLRELWAKPKGISAIASALDAKPGYVRARAMRRGLKQRPRSSLTG